MVGLDMEKKARKPRELKPIQEYATGLLARREHATAELRRKLAAKGYGRGEIEAILGELRQRDYLNDERYAEARARSRAKDSKWGATRIRQELNRNGVAAEVSTDTLAELGETHDWLATAQALVRRKFPQPLPSVDTADPALGRMEAIKERQKEKARRISFLTRRGFTVQQSLQALELSADEVEE